MKLRIKGNSIRLRLGQSEVKRLATTGAVEESTLFGPSPAHRFVYALRAASGEHDGAIASFAGRSLVISLPQSEIHQWASTEQVAIVAIQQTGDDTQLRILIEKDFECIEASPEESQEDAYPHPQFGIPCAAGKQN